MLLNQFLILAAALFSLGIYGLLVRRNLVLILLSVELMLNAVNLSFVALSSRFGNIDGQTAVFFVLVVAAAEVVVGLAIIVSLFRSRHSASVDDASLMKL